MSLSFSPDSIEYAVHTKSGNLLVTGGFLDAAELFAAIERAWNNRGGSSDAPILATPGIYSERGYYGAALAAHNTGSSPWPEVLINPDSIESIIDLR